MAYQRYVLTPEIQEAICKNVRAGSYPHVASEGAGVPRDVFEQWLEIGSKVTSNKKYKDFVDAIMQARALARISAEIKSHKDHPLHWLKCGPGKETPDYPGWTGLVKPQVTNDNRTVNFLLHPEMQSLVAAILQSLTAFPEARSAVAEVLAGREPMTLEHQPPESLEVESDT